HFLQIDVRLIESVEQHQPIDIQVIQTDCHVCETAEVRTELDGERNLCGSPNTANRLDVNIFRCTPGDLGACRYSVDIQFQRIGAGLCDPPRVADPPAERGAI